MAWAEADRVKLRKWLGATALFSLADPLVESALTAVQSLADGGSRPDDSTETAIRGYMTKLDTIETALDALDVFRGSTTVDKIEADVAREDARLRNKGRRYVGHICDALGMSGPRRDVFSTPKPNPDGSPFYPGAGRPTW